MSFCGFITYLSAQVLVCFNSACLNAISQYMQRFIPLHDGTTSVGIVQNQDISNDKKAQAKERGEDASTAAHYHRELKLAPNIEVLMGNATIFKKPDAPLVSAASDYSYHATAYAGSHYRLVGDAACFVSPPTFD
jgi:flavin-dependent dehydrogenase